MCLLQPLNVHVQKVLCREGAVFKTFLTILLILTIHLSSENESFNRIHDEVVTRYIHNRFPKRDPSHVAYIAFHRSETETLCRQVNPLEFWFLFKHVNTKNLWHIMYFEFFLVALTFLALHLHFRCYDYLHPPQSLN